MMEGSAKSDRRALKLSLIGLFLLFCVGKVTDVIIISWWWAVVPMTFFCLIYGMLHYMATVVMACNKRNC